MVLKSGLSVHGLTTAACLWIVSAIGLAVGSGLHFAALLSFAITLVSLWLLRYVEDRIPRLAYKHVTIVVDRDAPEEQLRAAVTAHGPRITEMDYELDAESGRMTYRITIASEHRISEREIVDALARFPAVRHVRVQRLAMAAPNRLAREKSPYLLSHARNPVDWYPWGEEAFAAARARDVPLFVSIGYSACHWCHVMERECFEDAEVARLMNEHLVAVKVDREELPAVDHLFMAYCQGMTGSGGWPLTVVLTPAGKPFFAGTYFPKESGFGRPGMMELAPLLGRLWRDEREKVLATAEELERALAAQVRPAAGPLPGREVVDEVQGELVRLYDSRWGGFGAAPKFPTVPWLLLSAAVRRAPRGRRARPRHGRGDAARDAARRHLRPARLRLSPLLDGRGLARAALREDALRPGAARAGVHRGVPALGGRRVPGRGRGDLRVRAARSAGAGRRVRRRGGRRQRGRGGAVLPLERSTR